MIDSPMQTPKAIWRRVQEDGAADLKQILKRWPKEGFFIPPKNKQVCKYTFAVLVHALCLFCPPWCSPEQCFGWHLRELWNPH